MESERHIALLKQYLDVEIDILRTELKVYETKNIRKKDVLGKECGY